MLFLTTSFSQAERGIASCENLHLHGQPRSSSDNAAGPIINLSIVVNELLEISIALFIGSPTCISEIRIHACAHVYVRSKRRAQLTSSGQRLFRFEEDFRDY